MSYMAGYHCVTRYVRRAFLCGEDRLTGGSNERRRGWFAERIKALAGIVVIDVAGCLRIPSAFFSTNHYIREI